MDKAGKSYKIKVTLRNILKFDIPDINMNAIILFLSIDYLTDLLQEIMQLAEGIDEIVNLYSRKIHRRFKIDVNFITLIFPM